MRPRSCAAPEHQVYDRAHLLPPTKRNEVLALSEVRRYGSDSFGDPNYVRVYGLTPEQWFARGIRLLARTAVECTRDDLAARIARDVAAVARTAPAVGGFTAVDLFAGSGNTLFWIARELGGCPGVGFELDDRVFALARGNLELADFRAGLAALAIPGDRLPVVFVAPPWGDALGPSGLDLGRTTPPVDAVVDDLLATLGARPLLVSIQVHETVEASSLQLVASHFEWSALRIYDVDEPGRNHGVLLGTRGWWISGLFED